MLILTLLGRGVGETGKPGHFRTLFSFSTSEKAVIGLLLRRRPLYPTELRVHILFCRSPVRSIVAVRAWSALSARFALTNSVHFRLQRTAHCADVHFVCLLSYGCKTLKSISFRSAFVNLPFTVITGIRECRYTINHDFHSHSFLLQCQQIRKNTNSLDILKQEPEDSK